MSAPVPPPPLVDRAAVWTRHWSSGAAHSCEGSYGSVYAGAVAAFWTEVHTQTCPSAKALDIASGSGALPRLLLEARPQLAWHIDAIDIATVIPSWLSAAPSRDSARVSFHCGVAAEALPFDSASFDLVVSHYGFEYAQRPRALAELLRVLVPGGRVALVLHHVSSRPVALARIEIDHIDWLLKPDGLLTAAHSMIEPLSRARTAEGRLSLAIDHAANDARERFNSTQGELSQRMAKRLEASDILGETQDAVALIVHLAGTLGHRPALAAWQRLAQSLHDSRVRLHELHNCALSGESATTLADELRAAGLAKVQLRELREGAHLMGWSLRAG